MDDVREGMEGGGGGCSWCGLRGYGGGARFPYITFDEYFNYQ